MSGEVSGGFTDICLQKSEKRFRFRETACQEVADPCHEGGERHEKSGKEDIAGSACDGARGRRKKCEDAPCGSREGEGVVEIQDRGEEAGQKADGNRGKGEEKERQLPECGAVEGEEEGQRHAGEEDGCVVPWREDFARHGEVESVDKGKESKPGGRKAEKRM